MRSSVHSASETTNLDLDAPLETLRSIAPNARRLLERLGLDLVRERSPSLRAWCVANALDPNTVARLLAAASEPDPGPERLPAVAELMSLSQLCAWLDRAHDAALAQWRRLDQLIATATLATSEDPAFQAEILFAYRRVRRRIKAHLEQETDRIFPAIRRVRKTPRGRSARTASLEAGIAWMTRDHQEVIETLAGLLELTARAITSPSHPSALRPLHAALRRMERSLEEQIYIENQILFRRALAIRAGWPS